MSTLVQHVLALPLKKHRPLRLSLSGPNLRSFSFEVKSEQTIGKQIQLNTTKSLPNHEKAKVWMENGQNSYLAFHALLVEFIKILSDSAESISNFTQFMNLFETDNLKVVFLKSALHTLIDDDFTSHTDYVDSLLLLLTQHKYSTSASLLDLFILKTSEFAGFYLRQHEKRFSELFAYINSNACITTAINETSHLVTIRPHYLTCMHFEPKKIIVSNAPPVKFKRRKLQSIGQKFECESAAGGLVSGMKPALGQEDVWVSYMEENLLQLDRIPQEMVPKVVREGLNLRQSFNRSTSVRRQTRTSTNSNQSSEDWGHSDFVNDCLYEKTENDFMSLQKLLDQFSRENFLVNPLIIMKEDHLGFYDGIANGLFWPAFHDLHEYIIDEYKMNPQGHMIQMDWHKYIKVNYHFAIHAARTCRSQDFIWIHDYHLFLAGDILRSLDGSLDCGFFLHIPFRLSQLFCDTYVQQGMAILHGLLGFTRVGFQSNRDTLQFIKLIRMFIPDCSIEPMQKSTSNDLRFVLRKQNRQCSVGTFPISINTEKFLSLSQSENIHKDNLRQKLMGNRQGKLFLSVERFDYTKGILERLEAIDLYFKDHPERRGQDLFYQVAAASRATVSAYRNYQQSVLTKIEYLNQKYSINGQAVIVIDQKNRPQDYVVTLYKAADILVVTPLADGMNLVIKEAILCNAQLRLLLSTGSGAENQLMDAGFGDCYNRVLDVKDSQSFANEIYKSILGERSEALTIEMFEYTRANDISNWMTSFTDINWTHFVQQPTDIHDEQGFTQCMSNLLQIRRQAVGFLTDNIFVGEASVQSFQIILERLSKSRFECPVICDSIKRDMAVLKAVLNRSSIDDWSIILKTHEEHAADWSNQLKGGASSVAICICDFDDFIVKEDERQQSLLNGFLMYRWMARLASNTILISHRLSIDQMKSVMCFPSPFATLIGRDGVESNGRIWRCPTISMSPNRDMLVHCLDEILTQRPAQKLPIAIMINNTSKQSQDLRNVISKYSDCVSEIRGIDHTALMTVLKEVVIEYH